VREVLIAEVGLDAEERVFVRPTEDDFEYVYRATMEVYWDRTTRRLSHTRPPRDLTPVQWFQRILGAVGDEYSVALKLNGQTSWVAVPADLRSSMEAAVFQRPLSCP
jgi:hypothetical protein